ncbi:MAG: hypothetical protein K2Y21_03230 [Phycisphaerales bacterium]|nr:hypothetical protein [Phycisphaerales bacterium]
MHTRSRSLTLAAASLVALTAPAGLTTFFDPSQVAAHPASGVTSETYSSGGYRFVVTRDKLFTGGTGHIIGRSVRVPWPQGMEAQAVTTPPPGVTDYKARMTITREDGRVFDWNSFTMKLLANTGGAGAALEIMPKVNGEDAFGDPLTFDVTGYYGGTFSYDESPNVWGSTARLKGFATYNVNLYVDFAFTALAFTAIVPCPADLNADTFVDDADFVIFAAAYNTLDCADPAMPAGCPADLNADTLVDDADFVLFAEAYNALLCP